MAKTNGEIISHQPICIDTNALIRSQPSPALPSVIAAVEKRPSE